MASFVLPAEQHKLNIGPFYAHAYASLLNHLINAIRGFKSTKKPNGQRWEEKFFMAIRRTEKGRLPAQVLK